MKKLLNTLFISTQGAYLSKEGEAVAVNIEGKKQHKIPIHILESIVCFGQVSVSPYLLGMCAEKNVSVSFLTEYGRFLAKVVGPASGNVLLRREQFRKADDPEQCCNLSRCFLIGKLANSRAVLRRTVRDYPETAETLEPAAKRMTGRMEMVQKEQSPDGLRGLEGDAAHQYFSVFNTMIRSDESCFNFAGRKKRPPPDPVNCLLSFVYTLLAHDVRAALESVGLDSQVGFLHRDRPGRPGLALDLMEEFRSWFADRLVLTLINRGQVKPGGFQNMESCTVHMDDETRKALLEAYQERKRKEVMHPFLKERMPLGILFFVQALLLARCIRGEMDAYPPFIWK